jgi:glycosyltransferase involved in cell wall biosynthesis
MMKEKVFVSAIAYIHNEETRVEEFIKRIDFKLNELFEDFEIIIVNDFNSGNSLNKIKALHHDLNGNLVILNLSRKHGLESSMMAGLDKSIGDFVFEFDSTHIDYPEDILIDMYRTAVTGYDIVSVSPIRTNINSRLFYSLMNKVAYSDLNLSTERIRVVSRRALNAMFNLKEKIRYRKALYALTAFDSKKLTYEPTQSTKREFNRENVKQAFDIFVVFSNFGLRFGHYMSFVFFLFSLFMIGYSLYNYIFNQSVVEGWTTIMIMLAVGFSGVFFIMGMIGEYISRILTEVQNRPYYSIHSVEIIKPKKNQFQEKNMKRGVL